MKKVYYDKETGYLCNRYPKDIKQTNDTPFIEVDDELEKQTYAVEYGKFWKVVDGLLVIGDDVETQATQEYKDLVRYNEINEYQQYLNDTDYVITKLNEAKLEDENLFNSLKEKYAEVLIKRKEARAKINELEGKN